MQLTDQTGPDRTRLISSETRNKKKKKRRKFARRSFFLLSSFSLSFFFGPLRARMDFFVQLSREQGEEKINLYYSRSSWKRFLRINYFNIANFESGGGDRRFSQSGKNNRHRKLFPITPCVWHPIVSSHLFNP